MKSILLIGLGRFGRHVAMKLNELGHEVMAIDQNEERVEAVLPHVTSAQIGDSKKQAFMEPVSYTHLIWISSMMTTCPKPDQKVAVLCTTRPVTQTDDVAVKSASTNLARSPLCVAMGRHNSSAPSRITLMKPRMMTCAEVK